MSEANNESNKSTETEVGQPESIMALANRAGAAMVAAVTLMEEAKALEKEAKALEKDLEMRL